MSDEYKCEIVASDGQWTCGYIDDRAATWPGNHCKPGSDDDIMFARDGAEFFDGNEWLVLDDGSWKP